MFLDIAMTYCRGGPEFAAREVHDFGLLRVERNAVCRASAHHFVDGTGCHSSSFVYSIAYGQDGCVLKVGNNLYITSG
jgi:hypothetical protein